LTLLPATQPAINSGLARGTGKAPPMLIPQRSTIMADDKAIVLLAVFLPWFD
jgi:hypothetical protein